MKDRPENVVLEHLTMPDRGFRFITTHSKIETEDDIVRGHTGEVWYKIIGFYDTIEEAQRHTAPNSSAIPTTQEIEEHIKQKYQEREDQEAEETLQVFQKLMGSIIG